MPSFFHQDVVSAATGLGIHDFNSSAHFHDLTQ